MVSIRKSINLIEKLYSTNQWQLIDLFENRREFLKKKYLQLIQKKLDSFSIPDSIQIEINKESGENKSEKIYNWIESRDPSKNKKYLQWILNLVCTKTPAVPFEDLRYLPSSLTEYEKLKQKNKLNQEQSDINRIKNPSELDSILNKLKEIDIQVSKEEETRARKESKILLETDKWLALIPNTEFAAQFWGRGTEWCTAWGDPKGLYPTRECQFDYYNNDGELLILINKQNPKERYQLHTESEQYNDQDDQDMNIDEFCEAHPQLAEIIIDWWPFAIKYVDNPHEWLQLTAVGMNGYCIQDIKNPSEEVQLSAVTENGISIKFIENPSEKVQLQAIADNINSFNYIENPTENVKMAALANNPWLIDKIQNPSEELKIFAVTKNPFVLQAIRNPSEKVQYIAVKQIGDLIRQIPNPSEQVQLVAVKQNGNLIKYISNPTENVKIAASKAPKHM